MIYKEVKVQTSRSTETLVNNPIYRGCDMIVETVMHRADKYRRDQIRKIFNTKSEDILANKIIFLLERAIVIPDSRTVLSIARDSWQDYKLYLDDKSLVLLYLIESGLVTVRSEATTDSIAENTKLVRVSLFKELKKITKNKLPIDFDKLMVNILSGRINLFTDLGKKTNPLKTK